jgi:Phosphotransferase enzyme family
MIPTDANFDVQHSSFFQRQSQLPSPQTVRSQARAQHLAGINWDKRRTFSSAGPNVNPPPVSFESMGLLVKWGSGVRIAEGQSLYAVRHCLKSVVPVPEIYGWRTDGDEIFLYMEAISGRTLEQAWDKIGIDDRLSVCLELRSIFNNLRRLKQDPLDTFIGGIPSFYLATYSARAKIACVGNIARGPLYDRAINPRYTSKSGPFTSVKNFHDWFTFLHRRPMPDPHAVPLEPFRQCLPDDIEIAFTHGDLHRSNIILTLSSPPRVIAIVDWEQAGWLPAYWEDRKAHFTAHYLGEWSEKYLPMILDQYTDTWEPWDYYTTAMGC